MKEVKRDKIFILNETDFKTTNWSGGKTTEIFIYPHLSELSKRNFDYRISSAKVEVDKSEFSDFTGYNRILMILDGKVTLKHVEGNETREIVLEPFKTHHFRGGIKTFSEGKCIDFNLIYKDAFEAKMIAIGDENILLKEKETNIIYALNDLDLIVKSESKDIPISIREKEACVLKNIAGEVCLNNYHNNVAILCTISEV